MPSPGLLYFVLGVCSLTAAATMIDGGNMALAEGQQTNVRPNKGITSAPSEEQGNELLLGAEVDQLLKGNTSEGFTMNSGNYREYYAPDGTILGKDFRGSWWMKEDAFCASYPGITTFCYRLRKLRGGAIVWELDGEPAGYARLLSGNHFDF